MADIRCQMCGKLSSDELEICPFCQARLTPLHMPSPSDDMEGSDPVESSEVNISERIEGNQEADSNEMDSLLDDYIEIPSDPAELEVKEWLAGLDQESNNEMETPDLIPGGSADTFGDGSDDDWLSRLNSQENTGAEQVDQDAEKQDGYAEKDLVEWLQDFKNDDESERQQNSQPVSDLPMNDTGSNDDWLDRLQPIEGSVSRDIDDGVDITDEGDLGDVEALPESLQDSTEGSSLEEDIETPDWLRNIQAETLDLSEGTALDEAQSPDWMADLQAETFPSGNDVDSDERDMPAWLREIGADSLEFGESNGSGTPEISFEDTAIDQGAGDFDDEMALKEGLVPPGEKNQDIEASVLEANDYDLNSQVESLESFRHGSSLEKLSSDESVAPGTTMPSGSLQDFTQAGTSSDTPGSLDLDDGIMDDISGELETVDLPEWLKELKDPEVLSSDELMDAEVAKKLDAIPEGELPEWIQDMQPVESMLPQDEIVDEKLNEFVENTGPLAGLAGVLPLAANTETRHSTKPYQETPVLSGEQNQQVELFKQILNSESNPKKPPLPVKRSSQRLLRWIVTIIMLAAVLVPILINYPVALPASNYPPEMIQVRKIIFGLPNDSPVLMIFDYGPAYSAELEAAASSIVGDLINKNTRLVYLSTSPTGLVLADHLMNGVRSQGTSLIDPRVTELGYLPGDIQGMASFANNPSYTLPVSTDGVHVWEDTQVLQDVGSLSGFAALILLTENSETARNWIEQVEGHLGNTPLLMVVSAQAEPMIRPYFESGQVDGMVTGLAGGKAYEQAMGISGLSAGYWSSFRSGLFVIELIIIFGGFWSLFGSLRDRKLTRKEEV